MKDQMPCLDLMVALSSSILRCPAAMLSIPRETCSDSISKLQLACFGGTLKGGITTNGVFSGMQLFAYSWKLAACNWASLLAVVFRSFSLTVGAFLLTVCFCAYSERARLISTSTDCKLRSSTVSERAPTVRNKVPLPFKRFLWYCVSSSCGIATFLCANAEGLFLGRCPSTVRPVFPVLVFQLGMQQNRPRTTSSTVFGQGNSA